MADEIEQVVNDEDAFIREFAERIEQIDRNLKHATVLYEYKREVELKKKRKWYNNNRAPVPVSVSLVINMSVHALRSVLLVPVSPIVLLSSYQFHESPYCVTNRVIDLPLLHYLAEHMRRNWNLRRRS